MAKLRTVTRTIQPQLEENLERVAVTTRSDYRMGEAKRHSIPLFGSMRQRHLNKIFNPRLDGPMTTLP